MPEREAFYGKAKPISDLKKGVCYEKDRFEDRSVDPDGNVHVL